MPAAKRSAPKDIKMQERAKKISKKAEAFASESKLVENSKTEFQKECESILALLDEAGASIQDSAKDMLLVAIPFALKTPKADRHEFQDEAVNMLATVFDDVKAQNTENIKGFETKASEAATDLSSQQQALEYARSREADAKTARDAAGVAFEESTKYLPRAKNDLEEAIKQLDALKVEKNQLITEKAQREEFINLSWTKLKEVGLKGAELRARSKQLISIITSLDGEESLKLALPIALKSKPDQRGMIALKAIELTEEVLRESITVMDVKIEDKGSEIEKQHALAAERTATIESARSILEERQNTLIQAENSLMQAQEHITNKKFALQQSETANKSSCDELNIAQEKMQIISSLLERFDAIVECGESANRCKGEITIEVDAQPETLEVHTPEAVSVPETIEDVTTESA